MENPSHGFFACKWFVRNWFVDLSNLFKVVVYHLLIGGITSLGHQDRVLMVSALVFMVTHSVEPMVSHDVRLSGSHDFTKLLYCLISQPWENIDFVPNLAMIYEWDLKVIKYSIWIGSLGWKSIATCILNRSIMISYRLWDNVSYWVILRMCDHEIYGFVVIHLVEFDICS